YGLAASAFNQILVECKQVWLELDVEPRDRYGRLLAYVFTDSLFVNAELIRKGYAQVMTVPPNVRHVEEFVRLQREARRAGEGLWGFETEAQAAPFLVQVAGNPGVSTFVDRSDDDESTIVYITRTGTKYHQADCHHLRHSSIPITLVEARKRGYSACSACKPPYLF
ncbi:thermonuclease family protein, partial [bacterium]|nr:thermonuclease family protein [bacterium]